ncbi:MAG: zinc-ribbon domain-containing protein [Xanthobacteraceae bacterium]|nr:zinc-ribbon domain-containing protein [Xanthobacteraceae bacterium]
MRIECPSCAAGFDVSPSALEPNGRTVRCASCKTTWFAAAPSLVLADGAIEQVPPPAPTPTVSAEDRADHEALAATVKKDEVEDAEIVAVEEAPPVSPAEEMIPPPPPAPKRKTVSAFAPVRQKRRSVVPLGFVAALLFGVIAVGIMSRQSIVRAAPELASLYAAVGLPVNLRGLEFQNIRTRQEIQDGIAVLAIEGEVENVANRAVELPRVRLAVLGENGIEIYSWTALLPRSILYPHERVPFKSRLASPPAQGKEIMVRFLTRADLTASIR